jgi:predicted ATP-dependent serine protease
MAVESDAAVVLVLHNQASQLLYSVGADVLQGCDAIFRLDRVTEPTRAVRLSCDDKNRFGPAERVAFLEHTSSGLRELPRLRQ